VIFRIAGGALVASLCLGIAILFMRLTEDRWSTWTPAALTGAFLFTAVAGGLIGFFLTLRDRVQERLSKGEHLPLELRAYFGWGVGSLILWAVTIFVGGIAAIVFHAVFLSSGAVPPRQ
jgi:hypothetical protein